MKRLHFVVLLLSLSAVVAACTPQTQKSISDTLTQEPVESMVNGEGPVLEAAKPKPADASSAFTGAVLAGSSAPLLDFNQADYDQAVASGKIVVLYFYANWCPVCRAEFPKTQAAFDQLTTASVIGFRVNFKDNQTDDSETALAKKFGVAYQHTKVILKSGQQVLKAPDSWDTQRYLNEINKLIK